MKFFLSGLIILLFFLVSCTNLPPEKQCTTASDCVPAQCCHATEAANANYAPDCTEMFCTAVCEPGTLDCGQGDIQCLSGECRVVLQ